MSFNLYVLLNTINSVSYTHLDVYKRQLQRTGVLGSRLGHQEIPAILGGSSFHPKDRQQGANLAEAGDRAEDEVRSLGSTDTAVSYTHLDVYKRQVVLSSQFM